MASVEKNSFKGYEIELPDSYKDLSAVQLDQIDDHYRARLEGQADKLSEQIRKEYNNAVILGVEYDRGVPTQGGFTYGNSYSVRVAFNYVEETKDDDKAAK